MFKMTIFVRRKAGLSYQEFVDYYENHHAVLAAKLAPNVRRYVRNYLTPLSNANYRDDVSPPIDCVTEVWYDDEQAFEQTLAEFGASGKTALIMQDEDKVFDRAAIRWFKTVVRESDLAADRGMPPRNPHDEDDQAPSLCIS